MRLTTMTDYALRLLMYLGENPERLCTIAEIAQAYNISQPHLMKVTNRLSRTGWVETIRGQIGYAITDVDGQVDGAVLEALRAHPMAVRCELITF